MFTLSFLYTFQKTDQKNNYINIFIFERRNTNDYRRKITIDYL